MLDDELAGLLPIFIDETRERLERLASEVARLGFEPSAMAVVKRELHTVKGAARMMQLGALAELCHAAEDALLARGAAARGLLLRTSDRLNTLVERLAAHDELPERQGDLLLELQAASAVAETPALPLVPESAPRASPEGGVSAAAGEPREAPASPVAAAESPTLGASQAAMTGEADAGTLTRDLRIASPALDALAERATQVRLAALGLGRVVERLRELGTLAEEGVREPQPAQVLAVLATMLRGTAGDLEGGERQLTRAADEQLETLLAVQLQPLRGQLQRLSRHARAVARELGKEITIELEGEETRLDRRVVRDLEEALLHLVHNAVDHGLETMAERQAAGKAPAGLLRLAARARGARVELRVEDDGRGVDTEAVRRRAVTVGLVDAAAARNLSEEQAQQLLFLPGFSTRANVSELSGRGIGMDAVAEAVARLGGEVRLESNPGRGTAVVLEVPAARRGERVFVLRVGRLRLALPAGVVRSVAAAADRGSLNAGSGGRLSVRVGDRLLACVSLAAAFGQDEPERPMVVEGQVVNQSFALAVEAVEGEEEILLRPLPATASANRLLEGLAMLGSGQPVGVLSAVALAQHEGVARALPIMRAAAPPRRVRILLVDDSRVTREMERRLLEDAGFLVLTAGDGEEALRALGEHAFDCVVTDIEMPGMDGFRLTRELRALPKFANLPIVVVSTRDRPEDRLQGMQAGADAYLTKQSLNAGELVEQVRRLAGR